MKLFLHIHYLLIYNTASSLSIHLFCIPISIHEAKYWF